MPLPRCGHLRHRQHRQPGLDQHRRISWLSDRGAGPPMPDHPRSRPDLHPSAAAPGVDHHALPHPTRHRLPHRHLRPAGDVTLAPRGHPIRTMDCLHGDGPVLYGRSHIPHWLLHERGWRSAVQAAQQHSGGLLLRALRSVHILHHRGPAVCREGVLTWLTQPALFLLLFFVSLMKHHSWKLLLCGSVGSIVQVPCFLDDLSLCSLLELKSVHSIGPCGRSENEQEQKVPSSSSVLNCECEAANRQKHRKKPD